MLLPLTPLQSRSERQSSAVLQIFTHATAVPDRASHTESSGHSLVDPDVVQVFVQYPPGTEVLQLSPSSQPSMVVQVPATFGGSSPHAASITTIASTDLITHRNSLRSFTRAVHGSFMCDRVRDKLRFAGE